MLNDIQLHIPTIDLNIPLWYGRQTVAVAPLESGIVIRPAVDTQTKNERRNPDAISDFIGLINWIIWW